MGSKGAVLVTRPCGQATVLCDALRARGYTPYEQPLLEILGLPALSLEANQQIANLDKVSHLIFISSNAVRFGMEKIQLRWPRLPDEIQVYAIGTTTASLLTQYGLEVICANTVDSSEAMTSESLLAVEPLLDVEGQHILIVKGLAGRSTLAETLTGRGALVENVECYQRKCPNLAAGELAGKISAWGIDLILISSGEGLCNLLTLLSPAETIMLCAVPVIVPSTRVAQLAKNAGFTAVVAARNASNDAMLEMVEHCRSMSENNK